MVDVLVTLEISVGWLDFDFAAVALTAQVELLHRNGQELGVRTDIGRHRHLGILDSVGLGESFQTFRRVANGSYRNILDDQVSKFKIWLGV